MGGGTSGGGTSVGINGRCGGGLAASLERGEELEGGAGGGDGRVVGDGEVAGVTDEVVDHVRGKRGEIVGIDASTEERLL